VPRPFDGAADTRQCGRAARREGEYPHRVRTQHGGAASADLAAAFPAALRGEAAELVQVMGASRWPPAGRFAVTVEGKPIVIPYRIYHPEPSVDVRASLSSTQQRMLRCLYTRHHDGRVRQRCLEDIVGVAEAWVAPFVVQLVGEYVVQILEIIRRALIDVDKPGTALHEVHGRFVAENSDFIQLTRQRAISYWDCYYRGQYADRTHYPGLAILASLQAAGRHYGYRG
jgi:hypothetical protein